MTTTRRNTLIQIPKGTRILILDKVDGMEVGKECLGNVFATAKEDIRVICGSSWDVEIEVPPITLQEKP